MSEVKETCNMKADAKIVMKIEREIEQFCTMEDLDDLYAKVDPIMEKTQSELKKFTKDNK